MIAPAADSITPAHCPPAGDSLPRITLSKATTIGVRFSNRVRVCLLYTSDAAAERSSVDLGGRRIIKKKIQEMTMEGE